VKAAGVGAGVFAAVEAEKYVVRVYAARKRNRSRRVPDKPAAHP